MKKESKQSTEWAALNLYLKTCPLGAAKGKLAVERRGKKRLQFMLRIQSRINRLSGQEALAAIRKECA